jgi:hypothetical protein
MPPERGGRARRGLTCANCRTRKVSINHKIAHFHDTDDVAEQTRCDGTLPGCKTCEVYNVTCNYERVPPMSQVLAMAKRLQASEDTVAQLRVALGQTPSQHVAEHAEQAGQTAGHSSRQDGPKLVSDHANGFSGTEGHNAAGSENDHSPTPETDLLSDLSLDEHGKASRFCASQRCLIDMIC